MWLCWCACKSSSLRLDINNINNHNGNNGATAPPSRWQQQQQHQQQRYPTTQGSTQWKRYGMGDRDVVAEKWGSRHVASRAPGTFFFSIFFSLFLFLLLFRATGTTATILPPLYDDKGPKRRVSRRLVPRWVLFFFSFVFFLVPNDIHRFYILSKGPEGLSSQLWW